MVTMAGLQGNVESDFCQSSDMKREHFRWQREKKEEKKRKEEKKAFWGLVLINIAVGKRFDRENGF